MSRRDASIFVEKHMDNILSSFNGKFGERNKSIFKLMYNSGIRITEICNINIEDVVDNNWDVKTNVEVKALNKTRVVKLSRYSRDIIKKFLPKDKNERGPLIISNKNEGITPRQIQRIFEDISNKVGEKILPSFCYFNYNNKE